MIDAHTYRLPIKKDAAPHEVLVAKVGEFRLELSVSPTGRSKQVWINNEKVWPRT